MDAGRRLNCVKLYLSPDSLDQESTGFTIDDIMAAVEACRAMDGERAHLAFERIAHGIVSGHDEAIKRYDELRTELFPVLVQSVECDSTPTTLLRCCLAVLVNLTACSLDRNIVEHLVQSTNVARVSFRLLADKTVAKHAARLLNNLLIENEFFQSVFMEEMFGDFLELLSRNEDILLDYVPIMKVVTDGMRTSRLLVKIPDEARTFLLTRLVESLDLFFRDDLYAVFLNCVENLLLCEEDQVVRIIRETNYLGRVGGILVDGLTRLQQYDGYDHDVLCQCLSVLVATFERSMGSFISDISSIPWSSIVQVARSGDLPDISQRCWWVFTAAVIDQSNTVIDILIKVGAYDDIADVLTNSPFKLKRAILECCMASLKYGRGEICHRLILEYRLISTVINFRELCQSTYVDFFHDVFVELSKAPNFTDIREECVECLREAQYSDIVDSESVQSVIRLFTGQQSLPDFSVARTATYT